MQGRVYGGTTGVSKKNPAMNAPFCHGSKLGDACLYRFLCLQIFCASLLAGVMGLSWKLAGPGHETELRNSVVSVSYGGAGGPVLDFAADVGSGYWDDNEGKADAGDDPTLVAEGDSGASLAALCGRPFGSAALGGAQTVATAAGNDGAQGYQDGQEKSINEGVQSSSGQTASGQSESAQTPPQETMYDATQCLSDLENLKATAKYKVVDGTSCVVDSDFTKSDSNQCTAIKNGTTLTFWSGQTIFVQTDIRYNLEDQTDLSAAAANQADLLGQAIANIESNSAMATKITKIVLSLLLFVERNCPFSRFGRFGNTKQLVAVAEFKLIVVVLIFFPQNFQYLCSQN